MIEIVSATRLPEGDFWAKSALGLSLQRIEFDDRWAGRIAFGNRRGLPAIYNARIEAGDNREILVFMHDDVWIDDFHFIDRLIEGLGEFDVIGVAGNRRRLPGQPAWMFADARWTPDDEANLSGAIAHGEAAAGRVSWFGPAPAACESLDGVFLAARKAVLVESGLRFDPRFDFHLYDMDFCRSARQRGLRLGTWPISLTHQSSGRFGPGSWEAQYRAYLEKWGD